MRWPFQVVGCDLVHRLAASDRARDQVAQRLLPQRPSHCEAVEAAHRGGDAQPFDDLCLIRTAAKHDAADVVPAAAARGCYHLGAGLCGVQALDLPDVGFHTGVLHRVDDPDDQAGTDLTVVAPLVAVNLVQLPGAWPVPAARIGTADRTHAATRSDTQGARSASG